MSQFLTPQQVAARWGCTPEFVQRLCARREIRALKLGKWWRIPEDAVLAYEAAHTSAPVATPIVALRQRLSQVHEDGEYEPIFSGPVPWRETIDGAHNASGQKKARPSL